MKTAASAVADNNDGDNHADAAQSTVIVARSSCPLTAVPLRTCRFQSGRRPVRQPEKESAT